MKNRTARHVLDLAGHALEVKRTAGGIWYIVTGPAGRRTFKKRATFEQYVEELRNAMAVKMEADRLKGLAGGFGPRCNRKVAAPVL